METFKRTLGIGDGRVADFKTCSRQSDVYLYTYCRGAALPDAGWSWRRAAGLPRGACSSSVSRGKGYAARGRARRRMSDEPMMENEQSWQLA